MTADSSANTRGRGIVRIVYRDHVLFRHANIWNVEHLEGVRRECVGWIVQQDDDRITIVFDKIVAEDAKALVDRGVMPPKDQLEGGILPSGLVLLRALVEEVMDLG